METGVDSTDDSTTARHRLAGSATGGSRTGVVGAPGGSRWAVQLPSAALPSKPAPARSPRRAGRPAELARPTKLAPSQDLDPFPSGAPTEEIPVWLPADHRARPADARSLVSAAKARARTALGTATVVGTDLAAQSPAALSQRPTYDLLVDTAPGLSKFNIGMVPAPVTPPASWRRAAWFSSVSASLVLASLVTVASVVQSTRQVDHRDALPDYPNVQLRTTTNDPSPSSDRDKPGNTNPEHPGGTSTPGKSGAPGSTSGPGAGTIESRLPGGVIVVTETSTRSAGNSGEPTTTGDTTSGLPTTTSSPGPTRTSPPNTMTQPGLMLVRSTNTAELAPTTQKFFELASSDLRAAFDKYGSPSLKSRGFAAFAKDFAGVRQMEPTTIFVQPGTGSTVTTLKVTRTDGSTTTQHRKLTFTSGDTPLVDDEQQV